MSNEQNDSSENGSISEAKKGRIRSPNYPLIDLGKAVELAGTLHQKYGRHAIPVNNVHKTWELKEGSGVGNQYIAALKAYGLVDIEGMAEKRKITISDKGERIIRKAPDYKKLIQDAALAPTIYREIWGNYKGELPPDDILKPYLEWERPENTRFNPKSVDPFIACLRATLAYAGIDKGNINDKINSSLLPENQGQKSDDIPEVLPPSIKPERKRKMSPSGVKEDVFTLDSGEVVLQWPERLSQADFDDFEGWIQLVLRKVKRCITNEAGIGPEESS